VGGEEERSVAIRDHPDRVAAHHAGRGEAVERDHPEEGEGVDRLHEERSGHRGVGWRLRCGAYERGDPSHDLTFTAIDPREGADAHPVGPRHPDLLDRDLGLPECRGEGARVARIHRPVILPHHEEGAERPRGD
ncbi:MAG: hypothetical protein ACK55I_12040, partial [bacterium]